MNHQKALSFPFFKMQIFVDLNYEYFVWNFAYLKKITQNEIIISILSYYSKIKLWVWIIF